MLTVLTTVLVLTSTDRVIASLPIVVDESIVVPVRVSSQDCLFLLDTGSTSHVFDESLRDVLGVASRKQRLASSRGESEVRMYACPDLFLAGVNIKTDELAICADLSAFRAASGIDVRGVLGLPLVHRWVVKIDVDERRLQLLKNASESDGEVVPVLDAGPPELPLMSIAASVGPDEFTVIVDTGDSGSADLADPRAVALERRGAAREIGKAIVRTVHGDRTERRLLLSKLSIANCDLSGIVATTSAQDAIGFGVLKRFVITIDWPHRAMYLRKGRAWDTRDPVAQSGLHILKIDGKVTVHSVDPDSPAARAGVMAKDAIESVGGVAVSKCRLNEVRRRLQEFGPAPLRIEIRRISETHILFLRE